MQLFYGLSFVGKVIKYVARSRVVLPPTSTSTRHCHERCGLEDGWMDILLPSHLSSGVAQSVVLPSTELMKEAKVGMIVPATAAPQVEGKGID